MVRRLAVAGCLSIIIAFIVAACGDGTPAPASPTATSTATTREAPSVATPTAIVRSAPTATPVSPVAPVPTPNPFLGVTGIVDPTNFGWPREVEGLNGRVTIPSKPQRIITASVGHDEMTYALVPIDRVVGVGQATKNDTYSNVADIVQGVAEISRDPEVILARSPDVVVTSPFFKAEAVEALERAGIPVIQTAMVQDPEARISSLLLLGYIYGEEERAVAFAEELRARLEDVRAVTSAKPDSSRLRVLALTSYSDKIYTAGANSTEGSIIVAGGGINVAAEAGLEQNPTISMESIIAMAPDVIIIPQPTEGAEDFMKELLENAALAEVPAIVSGRVIPVESKYYTTLSHWNLLGVEDMARILWPDDFEGRELGEFSSPR